jgi:hypothetical protein
LRSNTTKNDAHLDSFSQDGDLSRQMFVLCEQHFHLLLHFHAWVSHPHAQFFLQLPDQHRLFLQTKGHSSGQTSPKCAVFGKIKRNSYNTLRFPQRRL